MLTIRHFEELSLNALPSLETLYYDGWVLRFAGGYPRRANSVQQLYPSTLPLDEKIAYCEAQYDARGFRTVFKFTAHAPRELEVPLKARGYVTDCETCVHTLDLAALDAQPENPLPPRLRSVIESRLSEDWFADCARLNAFPADRAGSMQSIFARIPVAAALLVYDEMVRQSRWD